MDYSAHKVKPRQKFFLVSEKYSTAEIMNSSLYLNVWDELPIICLKL